MKNSMSLFGVVGLVVFAISLMGLIYYGMWRAWIWVLPQIYPSGNDAFIRPSFTLFMVMALLVSFIGKSIFGSKE